MPSYGGVPGSSGCQDALEQRGVENGCSGRVFVSEKVDLKPKVNEEQSGLLTPGAPPPFYARDGATEDMLGRKEGSPGVNASGWKGRPTLAYGGQDQAQDTNMSANTT